MNRLLTCIVIIFALSISAAPLYAQEQKAADTSACLDTIITPSPKRGVGPKPVRLKLEIAATPEARRKGLMGRKQLTPCNGMAFFFPRVMAASVISLNDTPHFVPQKFWMKDVPIPLDVMFVDANHRIVHIEQAQAESVTPFGPDIPIATVIEIDGGRASREGISVGDTVTYEIATAPHMLAR